MTVARRAIVLPADFPRIVCICGSRRFARQIDVAAIDQTLRRHIVLRPDVTHPDIEGFTKQWLDELHLRKIDLADEVLVVGDYIGESTGREIDYAITHGKYVRTTEPLGSLSECSASPAGWCGIHHQRIEECERDFRDQEIAESESEAE